MRINAWGSKALRKKPLLYKEKCSVWMSREAAEQVRQVPSVHEADRSAADALVLPNLRRGPRSSSGEPESEICMPHLKRIGSFQHIS